MKRDFAGLGGEGRGERERETSEDGSETGIIKMLVLL